VTVDDRRRGCLVSVAVVVVFWGLITHGTYAGSGDDPHYVVIAHSIAFDGDLDVANDYAMPGSLIGGGGLEHGRHAIPGKDGVLRPIHDVGLPLLAAPYVRIVYPLAEWAGRSIPPDLMRRARLTPALIFRHSMSLAMAVITAIVAYQLFASMIAAGDSLNAATGWALLIALTPPLLSHGFLFFTEVPAALIVLVLFRTLTNEVRLKAVAAWALVGLAIGLLLLIHVRYIGLVAVFAGWAGLVLRRRCAPVRLMVSFALGLAIPLAGRALVEWTFWGTLLMGPVARPDLSIAPVTFVTRTLSNLAGIFLDFDFGLLPSAPLYALAFVGLVRLWRRVPGVAAPLCAIVGLYLATIAIPAINVYGWKGGWSPAARMITPVVPLLGLAVHAAARDARGAFRGMVVVLVLIQAGMDAVDWQQPKRLWDGAVAAADRGEP
jgi:hypothetical protein